MSGNIFLLQNGDQLVRMQESRYDSEALLQELLANYPDLLGGDQIDADQPRRWLLVSREMAVPDEIDGAGRWYLDHLFLDQDAVPTLVEVKRSSDTRIRREVIGQMLDYAANAVIHWPVETIRSQFERTAEGQGLDPTNVLVQFLGNDGDVEAFWQKVKTNLQAEKIRLLFVADEIPQELRRVIEFLNGQMDPAEVLAIEVKQYVGRENLKTLVPRLVGQTAIAQQRKAGGTQKQQKIDEQSFLDDMLSRRGAPECDVARRIIAWSKQRNLTQNFNRWPKISSFIPVVETPGGPRYPISVQTQGDVWLQMRWLRDNAPFREEAKRSELWRRLNQIPGVAVPQERMTGYPSVLLHTLMQEASLKAFLETLSWVVEELRNPPAS